MTQKRKCFLSMKSRNFSVSLAKFLASVAVILCHAHIYTINNTTSEFFRPTFTVILADGVAFFFFITGFYYFKTDHYKTLLKKTFFKVALPGFAMITFYYYFYNLLVRKESFAESGVLTLSSQLTFYKDLISFQKTDVYWYVYAYLLVVIFFPVLKGFYQYLIEDEKREKHFLFISLGLLIFNDLFQNHFLRFDFSGVSVLVPTALLTLWGALLFRHKEDWFKDLSAQKSILLWLILSLVRACIYTYTSTHEITTILNSYYSCFGFLSAFLLLNTIFKLSPEQNTSKVGNVIHWLSSYTYPIYLIHPFLLCVTAKTNYFIWLSEGPISSLYGPLYLLVAVSLTTVIFYSISLLLSVILTFFVRTIKSIGSK